MAALALDIERKNVAHAYLFSGPSRIGKSTVARWFATQLFDVGQTASDTGRTAEMVEKLLHPEFLVLDALWMEEVQEDLDTLARSTNVSQDHRRKARSKTDTISIDDIRAIQERLQETGSSAYRCALICDVQRMQDEAVNALLKILEEPPSGVVFLLTTDAERTLLPTLVSRCRSIQFSPVNRKEMLSVLQGIPEDDAAFIERIAQGAPGMAFRLLREPELLRQERQAYANAIAFWNSTSSMERLRLLEPLEKRSAQADRFLAHLLIAQRHESPLLSPDAVRAVMTLERSLATNASRPLMLQEFVWNLQGGSRVL